MISKLCRQMFVKLTCMFGSMVVKIDFSWVNFVKNIVLIKSEFKEWNYLCLDAFMWN